MRKHSLKFFFLDMISPLFEKKNAEHARMKRWNRKNSMKTKLPAMSKQNDGTAKNKIK